METTINQRKPRRKLFTMRNMVLIAMLAALSTVAYWLLEVPIIPFAPHLKVNFADIPAMVAALVISPLAGGVVVLIRCLIHLLKSSTFGIGELIDFILGICMVIPFAFIYNNVPFKLNCAPSQKKRATTLAFIFAAIVSYICLVIGGLVSNAALYPLFMTLIGQTIESQEVFITYLISTIASNSVRFIANVIPCIMLVPFLGRFRKAAYEG